MTIKPWLRTPTPGTRGRYYAHTPGCGGTILFHQHPGQGPRVLQTADARGRAPDGTTHAVCCSCSATWRAIREPARGDLIAWEQNP